MPRTKGIPDSGQPCLTPRSRMKTLQRKTVVCDTASYVAIRSLCPIFEVRAKIKLVKSLKRKLLIPFMESNAFSKSRKTARPRGFFAAQYLTISLISLTPV